MPELAFARGDAVFVQMCKIGVRVRTPLQEWQLPLVAGRFGRRSRWQGCRAAPGSLLGRLAEAIAAKRPAAVRRRAQRIDERRIESLLRKRAPGLLPLLHGPPQTSKRIVELG